MTWIVVSSFFLLVAIIAVAVAIISDPPANEYSAPTKTIAYIVAASFGLFFIFFTIYESFEVVDNGRVGVVKSFGQVTGELDNGTHMVMPWTDVIEFNTLVQTMRFSGEDHEQPAIAAFSSETQNASVKVTLNYNVSEKDVKKLYQEVGANFVALIPSRVNQVVKDESVKYAAVDLAPNREKLRASVRERLRKELSPFSINVLDVNIDNISFSAQFEKSIEDKQEATQAALKAQQQVASAKYEAQSKVEQAKGDAEVTRQKAAGQADANRSLNASLSPNVLQYLAIQKLSDKIQLMMVPEGSNTFFNLPGATKVATP